NADDHDEERKRQQQVNRLQDLNDTFRRTTIQIIYVKDDAVDRLVIFCSVSFAFLFALLAEEGSKFLKIAPDEREYAQVTAIIAGRGAVFNKLRQYFAGRCFGNLRL